MEDALVVTTQSLYYAQLYYYDHNKGNCVEKDVVIGNIQM